MPEATAQPAEAEHLQRRSIWERKYAIRACYRGWYERLRPWIAAGASVEVGSGSGGLKTYWRDLITTDVVGVPFVDAAADAMCLPLAAGSLSNLVCVDLLHHLGDPHRFFDEAARVLRPGGRILAIEPFITPVSYFGYRLLHHEDVWFGGYHRDIAGNKTDPWAGNLAMANILFRREMGAWPARHPRLRIIHRRAFSLLDFQIAGGFKPYAFVPWPRLYDAVLWLDGHLDWLSPLAGFRVLVVIESR